MASAPCITVQFPGTPVQNLRSVLSIALLRLIPSSTLEDGENVIVQYRSNPDDGLGNVYYWDASSVANDDGVTIVRPFDVLPLQAGRWTVLLDLYPKITPIGATPDGVTNSRAAFAAADAVAPITISPGLYLIGSNITLTRHVTFTSGARLVIPSGVTVTFSGGMTAPDMQVFNISGTGAVAGLGEVEVAWFAGDLRNTLTNSVAAVQRAVNAAIDGGLVRWRGSYATNGDAAISVSRGQVIEGSGTSSALTWTTAVCAGFRLSGASFPTVKGIRFALSAIDIIPASGVAVKMEAYGSHVEGCYSTHCYIGTHHTAQNQTVRDCQFNGATWSADWVDNVPNIQIIGCDSSAFSDWFDLSSTAGFQPGESLSWPGPGGGTYGGSYGYTCSSTRCKVVVNDVLPAPGAVITGGTSGASATLTSRVIGHLGGGLRMQGNAAGCILTGSSWAAGWQSLYMFATTNAHGSRPEYCEFSACYFDFAYTGANIDGAAGHSFTSTWINGRQSSGLNLIRDTHSKFIGCNFSGSWENGVLLGAGSKSAIFTGCTVEGANRSNNSKSGMYAIGGAADFIITSCRIGGQTASGYGGIQTYPVTVEVGCTGYIIRNNRISENVNNTVLDGGGGVTKSVGDNI